MKSLLCALDGGAQAMEAALGEAESFANHCMFSEKRCLQLRLLAEELLGMASGVLEIGEGTFWIEEEEGEFQLHLTARTEVGDVARSKLVSSSSTGRNELHKGVTGKIRQAMEWLMESHPTGGQTPPVVYNGMMLTLNNPLAKEWSLECYRQSLSKEDKAHAWDELEKSVLGKLADDVRVGVYSNRVHITVKKTF